MLIFVPICNVSTNGLAVWQEGHVWNSSINWDRNTMIGLLPQVVLFHEHSEIEIEELNSYLYIIYSYII